MEHGKELSIVGGYLICPRCFRNRKLLRVRSDTVGKNIEVYCRDCKSKILIDIIEGRSFESRSR